MNSKMNLPAVTVKNRVRNYEKKIKNAMNKDKPILTSKKKNPDKKTSQKPEKKETRRKVLQRPKKKKVPKKKQKDPRKLLMKLAKDLDVRVNKTNVEMENLKRMIHKRLKSLYKK